jgi:hypothetical protein
VSGVSGKQHVVLCEGFDDRAFWKGWLLFLGCADPSNDGAKKVLDAWGRPVVRGSFLFTTPVGSSVLVRPIGGRSKVRKAAREFLDHQVYRPARLLINLDSDRDLQTGEGPDSREAVRQIVRDHGEQPVQGDGPFTLGDVELSMVIWECDDAHPTPGLPAQQTLERLIAAAILDAYPGRGPVVEEWLAAEPRGEMLPKSYGYSYLAKWYAEGGPDDFLRGLWRDGRITEALRERLAANGAWGTVEVLVAD